MLPKGSVWANSRTKIKHDLGGNNKAPSAEVAFPPLGAAVATGTAAKQGGGGKKVGPLTLVGVLAFVELKPV